MDDKGIRQVLSPLGIWRVNEEQLKQIGKYAVDAVIGHGGMGIVYKAHDGSIGRQVAIKMMLSSLADNPRLMERFHREAQFTANLHHPNIVTVYDWGEERGAPYIVMEFLEGRSLDRWQPEGSPALVTLKKLNIIAQVCSGLKYAHEQKIVHRDIKPANIFVLDDESIKILDFGVARLAEGAGRAMTHTGQIVGSLYYMSPEQANGQKLDHRTDIFSVGVVLYELLAGVLPFEGRDTISTITRILTAAPPQLSEFLANCPQELEEVAHRALEKAPRDRYQTAEEFALDLSVVQAQLRRQISSSYLESAESAIERSDWGKAKEVLVDLLRLDHEHARGLDLLREVQQIIRRKDRVSEAAQLKSEAVEALEKREFKTALHLAEEAANLDNSNYDLVVFRDGVRADLERAEKARMAAERAANALHAERLDAAQSAVHEALSLDPANTHAKQLQTQISEAMAEQFKRMQVQSLLGEARKDLAERRYTSALALLRRAEELDANTPDLQVLLQAAVRGQQQERRERELNRLSEEIEKLISSRDFASAEAKLTAAFLRFPGDARLMEFDKRLSELRRLQQVRQALERAEGSFRSGDLDRARDAATEVLSLDASNAPAQQLMLKISQALGERSKRLQVQALIEEARQQLAQLHYSGAVDVLEQAESLDAGNPELQRLRNDVQHAQEEEERERVLTHLSGEIGTLISGTAFGRAEEKLQHALSRFPKDARLAKLEKQLVKERERQQNVPAASAEDARHPSTVVERKTIVAAGATQVEAVPAHAPTTVLDTEEPAAQPALHKPPRIPATKAGRPQQNASKAAKKKKVPDIAGPKQTKRPQVLWLGGGVVAALLIGGIVFAVEHFGGASPTPAPAGVLVDVSIESTPAGAKIQVEGNGKMLDCVTPQCALSVPAGSYSLHATLTGYQPANRPLNAVIGMKPVEIALAPVPLGNTATLVVETPGVQDALVFIDGKQYPAAGSQLRIPGSQDKTYRVHAAKDGYESSPDQPVTLSRDTETVVIHMKQLPNAATLALRNAAPNTSVLIDGAAVGRVNGDGSFETKVPPGMHGIQITNGRVSSSPFSRQFNARDRVEISALSLPAPPPPQPLPQPKPPVPVPVPVVDTAAQEWNAIKNTADSNQLNAFLQRHSTGQYADLARQRLDELDWMQANGKNDHSRLQAYLERHASGAHVQQARTQLEQLDWEAVKRSGDEQLVQSFLRTYPQGKYADQARTLLQSLRESKGAEAQKRQQAEDERGIRETLGGYRQAYENRNIDQLRRVWPSINAQEANNTQQSFRAANAIHMSLQEKSIKVIGDTAQVECVQSMQIVAGGNKQTISNSATFGLQRRSGSWVIERISYGKAR